MPTDDERITGEAARTLLPQYEELVSCLLSLAEGEGEER